MKKKSLLMTVVAFTALGLVGCNNKPTPTPSVSDQPATETPTSTVNTNDNTITRRGNTTFEVNQTATFRFNVTSATRNKLVNVEIDNPNVAAVSLTDGVDDHANNISNVKLLGIEPGTINRKVTSVETGNSKTFVLTVIAAKPTLKEALTALASAKNYTFTGVPEDESLKNNVTTTITKRVEKALTVTDGKQGNLWNSEAIDDKDADYYARYGIAVNSDNQAFYIDKNGHIDTNNKPVTDENFRSSAILAVSSSQGFLDGDNFAGDSEYFNSYLFNSFSLINPAWGPSTKADDNLYEITGGTSETEESTYLAFLECRLWNRVDPSGMISNRQAKQVYSFVEAASWIDTSVEVIDATDIKISITPVQGAGLTRIVAEGSSKEASYPAMVGTISNVGSTVLDSDIRNYLVTDIKVQNPGRNAAKKARKAAFSADSYTYTEPIRYDYTKDGKEASGTVYRYWHYTKNYVFLEVPEASKTKYQADTGAVWGSDDTTKEVGENIGFGIAKDGKVHELSYVAEEGSVAAHVKVGDVLKAQASNGGAAQDVTLKARTEFAPSGYFVDGGFGTFLDASGALYRLTDKADKFWDGDSTLYYNNYRSNSNCYDAFALFFFGITGSKLEKAWKRNDLTYFTLINTETASDDSVTALNIQLDARYPYGKGYAGLRLDFSLKDIGSAKSTYDTLITSALAA